MLNVDEAPRNNVFFVSYDQHDARCTRQLKAGQTLDDIILIAVSMATWISQWTLGLSVAQARRVLTEAGLHNERLVSSTETEQAPSMAGWQSQVAPA